MIKAFIKRAACGFIKDKTISIISTQIISLAYQPKAEISDSADSFCKTVKKDSIISSKQKKFLIYLLLLLVIFALIYFVLAVKGVGYDKIFVLSDDVLNIFFIIVSAMEISLAGAIMQPCLQSRFLSPSTTGMLPASFFGITFALSFPYFSSQIVIVIFGFLFALTGFILSFVLSKRKYGDRLIVSGFFVSCFFICLFIININVNEYVMYIILNSWNDLVASSLIFMFLFLIAVVLSWRINVISIGDRFSKSLGVDSDLYRTIFIIISSILTAMSISGACILAFIGVVVPIISRSLFGCDHRWSLFGSVLFGAVFVLVCMIISIYVSIPYLYIVPILSLVLLFFVRIKGLYFG